MHLHRRIDIKLDDVGEFDGKAGIASVAEQGLEQRFQNINMLGIIY